MLKDKLYTRLAMMNPIKQQALIMTAITASGVIMNPTAAFAASSTLDPILQNIGWVVITLIGIVGVFFTVKGILTYMKEGNGSIGKIVTTVAVTLLFIGLVLVLTNASNLAQTFKPIAQTGIDTAGDLANEVLQ